MNFFAVNKEKMKLSALKAGLSGREYILISVRDRGNYCDGKMPGYGLLDRAAANSVGLRPDIQNIQKGGPSDVLLGE